MTKDVLSRRLAVIVAADVVGYSRLMEADEAGTLAQLKSIRKELIEPKIASIAARESGEEKNQRRARATASHAARARR